MPRFVKWLAPIVLYALLAVMLTWPVALHPEAWVVGGKRTDVWDSLWSLWWFADRLGAGEFPLHTSLLNHPAGGRLMVADPLGCLLASPLVWLAGPVVAYNLLTLVNLVLGASAAHALSRTLGGRGWLAGVGYGFSAAALSHAQNGATEAMAIGWLPLSALALVWALRLGGWHRSLLAGLTLALCTLASWYLGVEAWLLVMGLVLVGAHPLDRGVILNRLLPGLILALAITLPVASFTRDAARAEDGLVVIKNADEVARLRRTLGPVDPRALVVPGDFRSPEFRTLEGNPSDYAHLSYLGFGLLGLAFVPGLLRRGPGVDPPQGDALPALFASGGAALLLSLGPVLTLGGYPVVLQGGRAFPLPYRLIEGFPGFDSLTLLYCLVGLTVLALAIGADRGVARIARGRPWPSAVACALVLVEILRFSPARGLPEIHPALVSPALESLARAPEGAVINLPLSASGASMYEQVLHGKPITAGLNTGANRSALQVLLTLRRLRDGQASPTDVVQVARASGVRYAVLHRDQLVSLEFIGALGGLKTHFPLVAEDDLVRVYAIW